MTTEGEPYVTDNDLAEFLGGQTAAYLAAKPVIARSDNNRPARLRAASPAAATLARLPQTLPGRKSNEMVSSERGPPSIDTVATLLRKLDPNKPQAPRVQIVSGMFFPCQLMYPGWWTRPNNGAAPPVQEIPKRLDKIADLIRWQNFGFEQWAPSIDIFKRSGKDRRLYGQIGHGDEANSLSVHIAPETGARLRDKMERRLAVPVTARGVLYHRSHCHDPVSNSLQRPLDITDYAVENDAASSPFFLEILDFHADGTRSSDDIDISILEDPPTIYSAYMWISVAPADRSGLELGMGHSIRLWEHINLLDKECLKIGYAVLLFRKRCFEALIGALEIVEEGYSLEHALDDKHLDKPIVDASLKSDSLDKAYDILLADSMRAAG